VVDGSSWYDSLTVIDAAIGRVDEPYAAGEAPALAVWGGLQLRASITAARKLDADEAYTRLQLAHEAADRLGDRERNDYYKLLFSRPNVAIHDVAVAVELGDGVEAVKRGATLRLPADMPTSRSGHHYLDMSRGWLWYGNRDRALAWPWRRWKGPSGLPRNSSATTRWRARRCGRCWMPRPAVTGNGSAAWAPA